MEQVADLEAVWNSLRDLIGWQVERIRQLEKVQAATLWEHTSLLKQRSSSSPEDPYRNHWHEVMRQEWSTTRERRIRDGKPVVLHLTALQYSVAHAKMSTDDVTENPFGGLEAALPSGMDVFMETYDMDCGSSSGEDAPYDVFDDLVTDEVSVMKVRAKKDAVPGFGECFEISSPPEKSSPPPLKKKVPMVVLNLPAEVEARLLYLSTLRVCDLKTICKHYTYAGYTKHGRRESLIAFMAEKEQFRHK
jgi:hypothetical protein